MILEKHMAHRFRVSLPGIKGFERTYIVNGTHTLHQFNKEMVMDMEFPQDQIVLFKGFDSKGALVAKYATIDLGQGSIDAISIDKVIEAGIVEFTYFYDTTNKKSVIITYLGEDSMKVSKPTLIWEKGPNPIEFEHGYVAFEDLPADQRKAPSDDDDEFDDIEEENDSEEEENIVDEGFEEFGFGEETDRDDL